MDRRTFILFLLLVIIYINGFVYSEDKLPGTIQSTTVRVKNVFCFSSFLIFNTGRSYKGGGGEGWKTERIFALRLKVNILCMLIFQCKQMFTMCTTTIPKGSPWAIWTFDFVLIRKYNFFFTQLYECTIYIYIYNISVRNECNFFIWLDFFFT